MKNEHFGSIFRESRMAHADGDGKPLSMQRAADELYIDYKTLSRYELGEQLPSHEMVCRMSRLYVDPALRRIFCAEMCDIGKLDNAFARPRSLFSSGYKLIHASEQLECVKNALFSILSDGVVEEDELQVLNEVIPQQIRGIKKILNEIEVEIERQGFLE